VAALNAKIRSQLTEKHSLELHCASLRSHLDREKKKSQTLVHEVDKLTSVEGVLSGHMDYLVKTREHIKMLHDKDMLTIKALEEKKSEAQGHVQRPSCANHQGPQRTDQGEREDLGSL
jgi:hypothetical protein